jgi:serine/threonine-protein kinase
VALKTLRPDLARDRGFVERFRAEAATLASLHHENLVQVYTFGIDGEDVYFVMELVEGEPLDDRIMLAREQRRHIPLDDVERLIWQIADALDAMHRAGILHRDVKPANILLDRERERAVLLDVGISKRKDAEHDPAGTPGFTPPECFVGTEEGPATDVYGLGALAYVLLTSAVPFGEDRVEQILRRQRMSAPRPASLVRPGLPSSVDEVLRRALEPDIHKRFQSATDLARALADALQHVPDHVRTGIDGRQTQPETFVAVETRGPNVDGSTAVGDDDEPPTMRPQKRPGGGLMVPPPVAPRRRESVPPDLLGQVAIATETGRVTLPGLAPAESPGLRLPSMREPEIPPLDVPQTRGVLFRSAYRVLGAKQGAQWVAQVSRRDAVLAQALQPQSTLLSWHPTSAFVTMLHAVTESGRDGHAFAHELGRAATAATFSHFFGADPGALAPTKVFGSAALFWTRYHTWGRVSAARKGDTSVEIAISEGPRDRLVCGSTHGILEQVALLAGGVGVEVQHVGCEGEGGAACVFRVTWTGLPS